MTLQVLFTCEGCGLVDQPVLVKARTNGQDVVAWVEQMRVEVADAHRFLSPRCTATVMKDLKIPLADDDAGIGAPL